MISFYQLTDRQCYLTRVAIFSFHHGHYLNPVRYVHYFPRNHHVGEIDFISTQSIESILPVTCYEQPRPGCSCDLLHFQPYL